MIEPNGEFGEDIEKIERVMKEEIEQKGINPLLGHLRLCGTIPERYGQDTTEEKLYSKYTDITINEAILAIGGDSRVLKERANAADVECVTSGYSFVADAKAFRLSRTAKNQKDFKVQAMDNWKYGKPFAMIVCPVYQLPVRKSQIYEQAGVRSVCIATYTHLAVLARYAGIAGKDKAVVLLHNIFKAVEAMNGSKDASMYWQSVNRTILEFDDKIRDIWQSEKIASVEAVHVSRQEALTYLASERERIMCLSKEQAIEEVLKASRIDRKIEKIKSVRANRLLETG